MHDDSRRCFLKATGGCLAAVGGGMCLAPIILAADDDPRYTIKARHVETLDYRRVKCKLCPRECVVDDLETGYCGVRDNEGGEYWSRVYGRFA